MTFKNKLFEREYTEKEVEEITHLEEKRDRTTLLQDQKFKKNKTKNRVNFITKYHKGLTNLNRILKKNWHLIKKSDDNKKIFSENPMIAFRRNKNIKELLIRSKLNN